MSDINSSSNIIYGDNRDIQTSTAYKLMSNGWRKTYDQLQSAEYLRRLGPIYIPRFPRETDSQYNQRLQRTFPQSFIKDVTTNLCSKPLSKPISTSNVPEKLEPIQEDADLLGSNLTQYFKQVFLHALRYGMAFTLVDYSNVVAVNKAVEQQLAQRPNFIFIKSYDMLNYKTDLQLNGTSVLTEITYRSSEDVGGTPTEIINTMTADGEWFKYVITNGEAVLHSSGSHTYKGIPLSVMYTSRENFMQSCIPFESIVDLNIQHTQVSSDYNNLITHISIPILFGNSFSEEEQDITISPSTFIHSVNDTANLKYVEHSGKGAQVGKERLEALTEEIARLGGIPLTQKTQDATATGAFIRQSNSTTDLQAWAVALEEHITECYQLAAVWINIELDDDFNISVYRDWIISGNNTDINTLMSLNTQGLLSDSSTLEEIKRRGLFSNNFNVDKELEKIEEEKEDESGNNTDSDGQ